MLGIILVTHGNLAQEFKDVLEHVMGPQENIVAFGIKHDDDVNSCREKLEHHLKSADQGQGVIILTDMFGGTPSNLAISCLNHENVDVLAGINLPMLIKLASIRENKDLAFSVREAQDAGKKYINVASYFLDAAHV